MLSCSGLSYDALFAHVLGPALIGFIDQSSRFLKPLIAGDTVYPMLEIVDLVAQKTTGVVTLRSTVHNQRGELIMEGEQRYLVRLGKTEAAPIKADPL